MRYVLLFGMLALSGCQTSGSVDFDQELRAYLQCNHDHAVQFARKSGDPYSLALAAEQSCSREHLALLYKLRARGGPGYAVDMAEASQRSAIRNNIATIARLRP